MFVSTERACALSASWLASNNPAMILCNVYQGAQTFCRRSTRSMNDSGHAERKPKCVAFEPSAAWHSAKPATIRSTRSLNRPSPVLAYINEQAER